MRQKADFYFHLNHSNLREKEIWMVLIKILDPVHKIGIFVVGYHLAIGIFFETIKIDEKKKRFNWICVLHDHCDQHYSMEWIGFLPWNSISMSAMITFENGSECDNNNTPNNILWTIRKKLSIIVQVCYCDPFEVCCQLIRATTTKIHRQITKASV